MMNRKCRRFLFLFVLVIGASPCFAADVVSFKDAAKLKSWDAWDEHKVQVSVTNLLHREKRSVTWQRLNSVNPGLVEIGRLQTRTSDQIKSSKWSVGCETLDRDYAIWDNYKAFLPMLGVKRARFFSGWAKTEQEKGVYDFTWLDKPIRECAAMSVKPWICISYGNPIWGSDFRLGMRVKQVTENPLAMEAWLRYVKELVLRYRDVVDEWEIWNEPFGQATEYAELFYQTARLVRELQPTAKIICTAISMNKDMSKSDYAVVLEKLKRENALNLVDLFAYHPYAANPDTSYEAGEGQFGWQMAMPLRRLVKSYSGSFDILQGEVGCPGQLEFAHALSEIEWTEYSQAKWNLRRAVGDAARSIPSSAFTMIDLQYTFMLQSFGLIRSNTLREFVYRRPSWYAMRNVYSLFDDETLPQKHLEVSFGRRKLSCNLFSRLGSPLRVYWFSDQRPSDSLTFECIDLEIPEKLNRPVWLELITGRVFEIPGTNIVWKANGMTLKKVPMWDSPIVIAPRGAIPLMRDWKRMSPYDIVDSFYRTGQFENKMKALPPRDSESWMRMKTADFLPCIDAFGQFKWRDWPGKTHSAADLLSAREEEEVDLSTHPGPNDRTAFGGWAKGPKLEATGRFRTHRDSSGKWWLVDPTGCLFWSFGPVRVSASSAMTPMNGDWGTPRTGVPSAPRDCLFEDLSLDEFWSTRDELLWPFFLARGETRVYDFSSANLFRKYGKDYNTIFAEFCHRRLRSWGMNTIANSSDARICQMDQTPYAERIECQSRPIEGSHGMWWKFRDPWDESFAKGVRTALEAKGRAAHDKWCIGFFIDNEINWGGRTDLAKWTIQSPPSQPAKLAFAEWLKGKYGSIPALNARWGSDYSDWLDFRTSISLPPPQAKDDLYQFSNLVIDRYFRVTRETVKAFDPDLLYLGCRFAGWARDEVVASCAKYCDVVSYNIYREKIDDWRLPARLDAPVLIGEFHFGATDRGPFGTGVRQAKNQDDRAEKMKTYVKSALENPQIVGVHWHQFSDQATTGRFDGEYLQVGLTDICDRPYPEMRTAVREVAENLYERRNGK
mgnify:FL=1